MAINWDRIAVTELDGEGSLLNKKVIPFKMEGLSSEQDRPSDLKRIGNCFCDLLREKETTCR